MLAVVIKKDGARTCSERKGGRRERRGILGDGVEKEGGGGGGGVEK